MSARTSRRGLAAVGVIAAAMLASPAGARAQDLEAVAALAGRPLPAGYYERVRRDPTAFTYPQVWRGRGARGFPHTADPLAPLRAAVGAPPVVGTLPVIVIPALFADSPIPRSTLDEVALQAALFDGAGGKTIPALFAEMSRGTFTMRGRVAPWVRTAITLDLVMGNSNGIGGTARIGEYLAQAVLAADEYVDYREYDNDGPDGVPNSGDDDGIIDALALLTIEGAMSCGGTGPWPHKASISGWTGSMVVTRDLRPDGTPIRADGYIIQDATNCTGTRPLYATTIAHELGHVLGLPDLYHAIGSSLPGTRRWVIGCWDLMSAGSWGCGDGGAPARAMVPTHMGAWSKGQLGWVTPTLVAPDVRDREYELRPVRTSGDVLRIPLGAAEYFDLEYRRRESFDVDLPASGVLMYRVDDTKSQYPCPSCPPLYRVSLVEADGDGALIRSAVQGGNRGVAGDAFGRVSGQIVSAASTPSTRTNDGIAKPVTIHSIVLDQAAGVARVRITTAAQPMVAATPLAETTAGTAVRREVRVTGGVHPYAWTITGALPDGLTGTTGAERFVIEGTALAAGTFPITVAVRDAAGLASSQSLSLVVREPVLTRARLLRTFTGAAGAEPLTAGEVAYLDRQGNRNGRYDVGDLRAYLRGHPGL